MEAVAHKINPPASSSPEQTALLEKQAADRFTEIKAQIDKYGPEYLALTIQGTGDVEGFRRMDEARKILVKVRTGADKINKAANEDLVRRKKINDTIHKKILAELAPIEAHVKGSVDAYNQQVLAEEAEAKRAQQLRIDQRLDQLRELGFSFDRQMKAYTVRLMGRDLVLGMDDVAALGEAEFANFLDEAAALHAGHTQAQREEADRLERQRLEQEQRQQQLDERERAIKLQQEALRAVPAPAPIMIDQLPTNRDLPVKRDEYLVERPLTPDECFWPDTVDPEKLFPIPPFGVAPETKGVFMGTRQDTPLPLVELPEPGNPADSAEKTALLFFADQLSEVPRPSCESFDAQLLLEPIMDRFDTLIRLIRTQANLL